jgi:hypothetical protein
MKASKEKLFCRNVTKSWGLGCRYGTCRTSNFPTPAGREPAFENDGRGKRKYTPYTR